MSAFDDDLTLQLLYNPYFQVLSKTDDDGRVQLSGFLSFLSRLRHAFPDCYHFVTGVHVSRMLLFRALSCNPSM